MVSTRAAMEARMDKIERRLAEMQEENVRAMVNLTASLTQQFNQLRRDRSSSRSRGRYDDWRARNQNRRQEGGNRNGALRRDDLRSQRDEQWQERRDDDHKSEEEDLTASEEGCLKRSEGKMEIVNEAEQQKDSKPVVDFEVISIGKNVGTNEGVGEAAVLMALGMDKKTGTGEIERCSPAINHRKEEELQPLSLVSTIMAPSPKSLAPLESPKSPEPPDSEIVITMATEVSLEREAAEQVSFSYCSKKEEGCVMDRAS